MKPLLPIAAALTPEIAPKIVEAPIVVIAMLPGAEPTPACTKLTSRAATLPRAMISPA